MGQLGWRQRLYQHGSWEDPLAMVLGEARVLQRLDAQHCTATKLARELGPISSIPHG